MSTHIVAGKYALLKRIASGGMAEIFLAKQIGMDGFEKLVVLKRILPHLADNKEFVRMFIDEARTAADLRHSNLVHTFEVGEDGGVYFMVMEFLHGQDVRTLFKTAQTHNAVIPIAQAVGIIIDAATGVQYAHSKMDLKGNPLGIIHRDISPQNLIVTYEGETKVVDFGIAKTIHQSRETISGVLKGKYGYMSPEQALGNPMDGRTDQFALGVVLYEMTTMRRLFKQSNEIAILKAIIDGNIQPPIELVQDYPLELNQIVMKALSKNRRDRFSDCGAFRNALENFLERAHLYHSAYRLSSYMKEIFKDRIKQEENWSKDNQQVEKALTLLWPASRFSSTSSLPPPEPAENSSFSYKTHFWKRAQLGFIALLGGGIGLVLVAFFIAITWSDKKEVAEDDWSIDNEEELWISYEDKEKKVEEPTKVEKVPHKREKGNLKVAVEPWAEVYLDGVYIGTTPMAAKSLPSGKYSLRLYHPQLEKAFTRNVTILPGKDTLIKHKWN